MGKKFSNIEILNSIRNEQTLEYQSRVKEVGTQEDCLEVLATFEQYPTDKNVFISALTNRIGKAMFFDKVFNNPYKMLHRGMLEYGKSIEQLFVEMAEQKGFGDHFTGSTTMEGDLISPLQPNVKVDYIKENYQYKFKTSISDEQLRGAFQSQYGLSNLITHTIDSLLSSVQYSEYVDMKKLLIEDLYGELVEGGLVQTVGNSGKEIVKAIRILAGKMAFPSVAYNLAGVRQWSKKQDLIFFTKPEIVAEIDVEVLAQAFNVSCTDVNIRVIELDELPSGCLGIVADKDLIQCYDTVNTTGTFYNAEQLTTNYFAHKFGLICGCKFANAMVLKEQ